MRRLTGSSLALILAATGPGIITIGLQASRQAPAEQPAPARQPAATRAPVRLILEGGIVEIRQEDGRVDRLGEGSRTTILPNGVTWTSSAIPAPSPSPPFVPGDSPVNRWLDFHRRHLLSTIGMLIRNDPASMRNLLAAEVEQAMSPFQSAAFRAGIIQRLLSQ
jgi:hypothetical protein